MAYYEFVYYNLTVGWILIVCSFLSMMMMMISGLPPIETLTELKARHVKEANTTLGVDCMLTGNSNMKEHNVIEALHSKKQQIVLATQLVKMILKIDDVRSQNEGY